MADQVLPDVNVLVALMWPHHLHHRRTLNWFTKFDGTWATTPITQTGLLRLSMTPAVVEARVLSSERHRFLADTGSLTAPRIDLRRLVGQRQVTDLHLVNLCAINGYELLTLDRRCARDPGPPARAAPACRSGLRESGG